LGKLNTCREEVSDANNTALDTPAHPGQSIHRAESTWPDRRWKMGWRHLSWELTYPVNFPCLSAVWRKRQFHSRWFRWNHISMTLATALP